MSEKLKNCPFCGGEAKVFKDTLVYTSVPNGAQYIVWCTKCGCRSPMNIENKEDAIEAWNTRSNPWHTGTPTEKGWYLIKYKHNGEVRYIAMEDPSSWVFTADTTIGWQKI